ncbi:S8 family peptidase [Sporosarcina sp. resist]|uniref:S8 family peptidase n=1 Tax=Sporosarcina sp. resist TaxID=2762563 RepID=UPI00164DF370|nr:S8 family peptidase [Sporosarcina sp. resist]QNK89842.1 S8 family peptidase [Sporosarcina sp. resist]
MNETQVKLIIAPHSFDEEKIKDEVTNNISSIGARHFWNQGYTGKGVVVAILDTGCNYHNLDLKDRIIGGYNFTKDFDGDINRFEDLNGHGTHVAGTIAASLNGYGIVGVAPDVSLLILKVLDYRGSGTVDSLVKAIDYAMNWTGPNNKRVNILSLSLGLSSSKENLHNAIKHAVSKDIAVVVASGNEGDGDLSTDEYSYPAGYEEVIAVGALDNNNEVANFTNTNKEVDIYAPGVDIKSTYLNIDFADLSGTSMAAPHVTGALALLINKYENLTKTRPKESKLFEYLMLHTTKVQIAHSGEAFSILNLSKDVIIKEDFSEQFEDILDKSLLIKCFCEVRKSQAFFTQCLNENSTENESEFLISLIQESASTAEHIKNLCKPFK